jgi:hypothetical protein
MARTHFSVIFIVGLATTPFEILPPFFRDSLKLTIIWIPLPSFRPEHFSGQGNQILALISISPFIRLIPPS